MARRLNVSRRQAILLGPQGQNPGISIPIPGHQAKVQPVKNQAAAVLTVRLDQVALLVLSNKYPIGTTMKSAKKLFCALCLGWGFSVSAPAQTCPKALPPSCVRWSLYDDALHWWDICNNCGRLISITYNAGTGHETTPNFEPGEKVRVTVRADEPPPYVVWDSADAMQFYRSKPVGAQLACLRSL